MKSKENSLLKNMLGWGKRRQATTSEQLYEQAVALARDPDLFQKFQVADDVDGRFDALTLMVSLIKRRLMSCGQGGKVLSQELFDSMFADMDLSLREMGAGDIGVSKRVKVMAEAFMGRLDAYVTAIDQNDKEKLAEAVSRNLLRGRDVTDPLESGLVSYIFDVALRLDKLPCDRLLAGSLDD